MARPGAGGLNVGRAAFLIVVGLVIGGFVLSQGDDVGSVDSFDVPTNTTLTVPTGLPTQSTVRASSPTTAGVRSPASFTSIAINATNTSGVAGKATQKLLANSYNAVAPGDATASVKASTRTSVIYYAPTFEREAIAVATLFGLPATAVKPLPTPPPSTAVKTASIVVLVGPDLKLT